MAIAMKLCKIAVFSILELMKKGKLVFSLLFSSSFLCVLFVIYAYGNLLPTKIITAANSPYTRSVTVRFSEKRPLTDEALTYLDAYLITDVIVESATDRLVPFLETNVTLASFRENNESGEQADGDRIFTDQELKEDGVIVSIDHPGRTIDLNGKAFPILRKSNTIDASIAFVPINSVIENQSCLIP